MRAFDTATDHTCVVNCGGGAPPIVSAPPQAPPEGAAAMVRGEVYVIAPNGLRTPVMVGGPTPDGRLILMLAGSRRATRFFIVP